MGWEFFLKFLDFFIKCLFKLLFSFDSYRRNCYSLVGLLCIMKGFLRGLGFQVMQAIA